MDIQFRDKYNNNVGTFKKLCYSNEVYYGGAINAGEYMQVFMSTHYQMYLEGMLNLLAIIAREYEGSEAWTIHSQGYDGYYYQLLIGKEMPADQLATLLRTDKQKVIDYYGNAVRVIERDNQRIDSGSNTIGGGDNAIPKLSNPSENP